MQPITQLATCSLRRLFGLLCLIVSCQCWAEPVVVVGSKSRINRLSKEQVANIFLGKVNSVGEVSEIMPLDQAPDAVIRSNFYTGFLGKTPSQLKSYWAKMVFTGKGNPPVELASAADVKRVLASNPSAVSYLDRAELDGSVRVVLTP